MAIKSYTPIALAGLLALIHLSCATTRDAGARKSPHAPPEPEQLVVFSTDDSSRLTWAQLLERAQVADIIVVGEQHDDAAVHQLQAALVKAMASQGPLAVCMEMFERDEQPLVDAFLAGSLTQETLVDTTDSNDWGGPGQWNAFYQPIVEAARDAGAPVIAANAARRFVRLARHEGFEKLAMFADSYPDQFSVPAPIEQGDYAERFKATMRHHGAPGKRAAGAPPAMPEETLDAMFRAQQVWDTTMADSTVRAQAGHGKALLLVGQFHTDYDGGLLLRMKMAAPGLKYLTLSVQQDSAAALREEDLGRADVVIYRP